MTGLDVAGSDALRMPFDRTVLVGNVVSGAVWLALVALSGAWVLALIGAGYVALASTFLAAVYGADGLTVRQEAWAWAVPWFGAVALWTWLAGGVGDGDAGWFLRLGVGLITGTCCYLGWQIVALAVRRVVTWRAGPE